MSSARVGIPALRPLRTALRTAPTLRALFALLFAAAVAQSLPLPVLALYAKDELGASDVDVVIYFSCVAIASLVAVVVSGHRSDAATARHLLIRFSFGWQLLAHLLMSLVGNFGQMLAVGTLFYAGGGVLVAQLLALGRETATASLPGSHAVVITAWCRAVFSLGYVAGAPLGSVLAVSVGTRPVLRGSAAVMAVCLLLAWAKVRKPAQREGAGGPSPGEAAGAGHDRRSRGYRLLLRFSVVCVLLSSGRVLQLAMLPVLLRDGMGAPTRTIGVALAIPPLAELVLFPLAATAATRWGRGTVYLSGVVALVCYYAGLTWATAAWQVFPVQLLYAVYGAAGIMLGIDIAQNLLPDRVSTATSVYLGHEYAAAVLGSLLAVAAVGFLGTQRAFAVPLAACALGLGVMVWLFARNRRAFDIGRPAGPPPGGAGVPPAR